MKQALGEGNSKNIYNFFIKIGLAELMKLKKKLYLIYFTFPFYIFNIPP